MLTISGLTKSFGSVHALKGVDLEIRPGEVVGLVGENGAGKSTLMRILAGTQRPSTGTITRNGRPFAVNSPQQANEQGVAMVFQEQSLLLNLSIAQNIFLGQEQRFIRFGLVNWRKMNEAAAKHLRQVGIHADPATLAGDLSFAERQMVELAKALSLADRVDGDLIILLDEPTSVLEQSEIDILFERVRALKSRASFVFVSHRLDEVLEISDRIYVMKDGQGVATMDAESVNGADLHRIMVGREMHTEYYLESEQTEPSTQIALEARNLSCTGKYHNIDLTLREGEILGIAGVIGSGREELIRSFFGFETPTSGEMLLNGEAVKLANPTEAVARGIGYIPSERRLEGLVMMMPIASNITLSRLDVVEGPIGIQHKLETVLAEDWIKKLSIRAPGPHALCQALSGGNQQKVVLAKWLTAGSRILILDHPTRGVDVGAKEEIFRLMRQLSREGYAIILIADTLEETIGLSHNILVMRDGEVTARIPAPTGSKPSQVQLVEHMV